MATDFLDRQLQEWHIRWSMEVDEVICRYCFSAQAASSGFQPFYHKAGCPFGGGCLQYPWQTLKVILSKLPSDLQLLPKVKTAGIDCAV